MKTKLRKIYYVPGLISAIIIPLVFYYLGNQKFKEINISYISLGLPFKYDKDIPLEEQTYTFEPYRNGKYQQIEVEPNSARKNSKFHIVQLNKLQEKNLEGTGIEFILDDNNTYDDFVSILNDLAITNQEKYGMDLDNTGHIFVLVNYKNPIIQEIEIFRCGTGLMMEYQNNPKYFKGYKKFQYQISQLPEKAFYIIFSFLIFLQISVLSLVRNHI